MKKTMLAVMQPELTVEAFLYTEKSSVKIYLSAVLRFIIALAGTLGTVFSFLTCIDTGVSFAAVAFFTAAASMVFSAAMSLSKKYILPVFTAEFGIYAVVLFSLRERFCGGLAGVMNVFCRRVYSEYSDKLFIELLYPEKAESDIQTFVVMTAVFIAMVYAYGIVYKSNPAAVLSVSVPSTEICLYFGLVPSYTAFFALLASWVAAFALDISMPESSRAYKRASSQCGFFAASAVILSVGAALLIMQLFGYTRPQKLDDINDMVTSYFSGEEFSNTIEEIKTIEIIKRDKTVNHGKLGENGNITFSGDTVLKVTMPKSADTVYLRGFVGSVYTGSSWEELPKAALSELEEINSNFSTEGLNSLLLGSYNLKLTGDLSEYSFTISNVGAEDDYFYMPYNIVPESVSRYDIKNDAFLSDGSDKWYGRIYDASSVYGYRMLLNTSWIVPSLSLENDQNVYRSFVYENYLDVPTKFEGADEVFGNGYYDFITAETETTGKSTLSSSVVFGRKLYYIRSWLRDNCEYSLNVGKLPAGKDFADYFLTETQKGSCSHFATAAVLLCRYAGIPARYVEGYVIKPGDFDENAAFGSVCTVDVTDARAHAWVEVYIDGYGWYPIEFTSGYGNVITAVTTASNSRNETAEEAAAEDLSEETNIADNTNTSSGLISEITSVTEKENITQSSKETEAFAYDDDTSEEKSGGQQTVGFSIFGQHSGEKRDIVYDLTAAVAVMAAVFIIIAAIGIRRIIIVKNCRKALEYDDKTAAQKIYKRFKKLARILGAKAQNNMAFGEYTKYLEEKYPCLSGGTADIIINTALKAEFGGDIITHKEISDMNKAMETAIQKYNDSLNRVKRFYTQFIIGLC